MNIGAERKDDARRGTGWIFFRRLMHSFNAGLILSLLVRGASRDHMRFIWALCACGAILVAAGWFEHLRFAGDLGFLRVRARLRVPYALRKDHQKRVHLPAFLRGNDDFDDDLMPYTAPSEDLLPPRARSNVIMGARMAAGALLFALSVILF